MRRLRTDSSCSYSGRSAQQAARGARGVGLRAISKGLESPSNPKVALITMGAGLRATAKAMGQPPGLYRDPVSASGGNVWRDWAEVSRRHSSRMPTVMGGTG